MSDEKSKGVDLDLVLKALEEDPQESVQDLETIHPRDKGKPFSVAQFKRWRAQVMDNLNTILGKVQQDAVQMQARIGLAWNGMNAVLLALLDKGLITPEEVENAGVKLMAQAKANITKTREAVDAGHQPKNLKKTPLETFRDDLNARLAEDKKEEG